MADAREITATVVVSFGGATSDNNGLVAEVDGREDGHNQGRTSFNPGDDVYILLYKTDNVTLNDPVVSYGTLVFEAGLSPEPVDQTDDLQFVDEIEATLQYPVNADGFTGQWLGNDLGVVQPVSQIKVGITRPVDAHFAAVYRIAYQADALVYRLTNTLLTGFDQYPIVVHFSGIAN